MSSTFSELFGHQYPDIDTVLLEESFGHQGQQVGTVRLSDVEDTRADVEFGPNDSLVGRLSVGGSGAVSHQVTICDVDDQPISGAEVWVSTDIAGQTVVAGTLTTDKSGNATFMLDQGTFYLWQNSTRFNFQNPTKFTVSE